MAQTSRALHSTGNDSLHPLSPGSNCKVSQFEALNPLPEDWRRHRRSRSVPTPIQTTANKRKHSEDGSHRTAKKIRREAWQSSENIQRPVVQPDGVNLKNGTLDHTTYEGEKPKGTKRQETPLEDPSGSGESSSKRRRLTRKNLKLLEKSINRQDITEKSMSSSTPTSNRSIPLAKRGYPTELSEVSVPSATSSQSGRAYPATDIRFEKALGDLNVKFARREVQPDAEDVKAIIGVMEKRRDSPEPDSGEFYETLSLAQEENEAAVLVRLTTLLVPLRDRPSNNHKTKNLLYRFDTQWRGLGSARPGSLPIPKPDLCITVRASAFSREEQRQMTSPYVDEAGFYPAFVCEVKTALHGAKVAERQNANNAISALAADFHLQQRLGHKMERKIRLITTTHNTLEQRYTGWFYVFGPDGKPEWCSKVLKVINFELEEGNGFRDARRANINLCERIQNTTVPQLHADLAALSTHVPATPSSNNTHSPGASSPPTPNAAINEVTIQPDPAPGLELHLQTDPQLSTKPHTPATPASEKRSSILAALQPPSNGCITKATPGLGLQLQPGAQLPAETHAPGTGSNDTEADSQPSPKRAKTAT